MRRPDAAVLRCASYRPADTLCMAEIGLRGIYPRDIPPQAFPVHGVNDAKSSTRNLNGVGDHGTPKNGNGISLLILRLAEP
jgi:hypothetical protein